jgi:putative transposase
LPAYVAGNHEIGIRCFSLPENGASVNKDVVRRVLASDYRPAPVGSGPLWLTFLGHTKDSLWCVDRFRCKSILLRSHWILVIMDPFTHRTICFGVHTGNVNGTALCRMFNTAVAAEGIPTYLSSDNDPLFPYDRWEANLRILEIEEIKSHPMENDFRTRARKDSRAQRQEMVDRSHALPVARQCQLLDLPRSTFCCQREGVSAEDLELMRLNDACHLQHPYYGSRRIRDWLEDHDRVVNRKRVQRLMRQLGMVALYPKRNTSRRSQAHRVYPYLLRGLEVTRPDPVRAADVTCVPMARGLLNVVAIMHWHSRKVLSSQVSNTMDTGFCVQALQDALSRYAQPEILNTDQGSQFAREGFTTLLRDQGIQIGMDGKGRWVDNVFVKRQWRSLKYEDIYLKAYEAVAEARRGIGR